MSDKTETDPELEADLLAFLQERLDADRTFAIADYLAERPERMSDLLADTKNTAALRMALSETDDPAPPQLVAEARRLQDRLRGQRLLRRSAPFAAAFVLFAAGWTGHMMWQASGPVGAPPLVEAALDAQAALELRHWMVSQPESTELNVQEIVEALGISLPPLPDDWTVRDVQIVATPDRPAIAIVVDAPDLGRILLMAMARNVDDIEDPLSSFDYNGQTFALFDLGRSAFVVVDDSGHAEQLALGVMPLITSGLSPEM
jgi:anti-sigma factor RsiW